MKGKQDDEGGNTKMKGEDGEERKTNWTMEEERE